MLSNQGANWGVKTAFFFSGTSLIGGVIYWLFMPEVSGQWHTAIDASQFKGRTFGELDELFQRRIPARRFAQTKSHFQLQQAELEVHDQRV